VTCLNYITFFSVLYSIIFLLCYTFVFRKTSATELRYGKEMSYVAGLSLLGLLLLQFVLSGISRGHVQDTGLFRAWTAFAEDHQLRDYYTTELYVDYPPVYLYVLFALGKLLKFLNISPDTGLYLACIRSIPIFFDGLTAFFVYKIGQNRIGQTKALALAFLCAVNPAQILNSTIWGQVDSVVTFFTAIMLIMLQKRQYAVSFTLLAILFLTKPQTVMFAPLLPSLPCSSRSRWIPGRCPEVPVLPCIR